jgi:hypothetical protein
VQICRHELLDRALIWNQRRLLHALREFEHFYNAYRPHRTLRRAAADLCALPEPITLDSPDIAAAYTNYVDAVCEQAKTASRPQLASAGKPNSDEEVNGKPATRTAGNTAAAVGGAR